MATCQSLICGDFNFILLSFATKEGSTQQYVPIIQGPYCLDMLIFVREENHGVPGQNPRRTEEINDGNLTHMKQFGFNREGHNKWTQRANRFRHLCLPNR